MSSNTFANALEKESRSSLTENGNYCLNSTGDDLVDLFSTIGSLRSRSDSDIIKKWKRAYSENKELALRILFYSRDIREGLGERRVFRTILNYLIFTDHKAVERNLKYIPEYGRWDDLYVILDNKRFKNKHIGLYKKTVELIKNQFELDLKNMKENKPVSLLAKWLKSINTSSKKSVELGLYTASLLGYSNKDYRKHLSSLRKYLEVTEVNMSNNSWNKINYSGVSSYAMKNYSNAFKKHDENRFLKYLNRVKLGKDKINSSTLYPSDLVKKVWDNSDEVTELQWKNLPNYVEGNHNALVIADTSGSMIGTPMHISVGLAIYFAERNKGHFHNLWMSFSSDPTLYKINDSDSLYEKVNEFRNSDWGYSTDLRKSFKLLLDIAIKNKVPKKDMIKSLIIISDMEIDSGLSGSRSTIHNEMKSLYESHGYELPNIIYWNANSRNDTFHVDNACKDSILVSGSSTTTFKNLFKLIGLTPYDVMLNTVNSPRYLNIK